VLKVDHEGVPRKGTIVSTATIQRPLSHYEAICDICGGRIIQGVMSFSTRPWPHVDG
jgi:hypothetical protein